MKQSAWLSLSALFLLAAKRTAAQGNDVYNNEDCIGLGRVYGEAGHYVQSDMQFAQMVTQDIRAYSDILNTQKLGPMISLNLHTRFFLSNPGGGDFSEHYIMASELYLSEGFDLNMLKQDENGLEYDEWDGNKEDVYQREPVTSQRHGQRFDNMYTRGAVVSLMDRHVHSFLFDGNYHFAGLTLRNLKDGSISQVVSPFYSGVLHEFIVEEEVDERHETTRLIGFRTTKDCATSKLIKSVQPIYYSSDHDICLKVLGRLKEGHLEEIPGYGPECHERSVNKLSEMTFDSKNGAQGETAEKMSVNVYFTLTTYILIWITFFVVLMLAAKACGDWCSSNDERIERKKRELKQEAQREEEHSNPDKNFQRVSLDTNRAVTTENQA